MMGAQPQRQTTPMLKQYWKIKADHPDPDTILFFRLGDFYEMFFDDAKVASQILDITLTTRNKHDPHPIPLCGIPYHAADGYVAKLIAAGKKVAICEQIEDPKLAKGVVQREVVRLITPGAVFAPESLSAGDHNYLAAIHEDQGQFGLAVIDISTGEFRVTQVTSRKALHDELERIEPRELVVAVGAPRPAVRTVMSPIADEHFQSNNLPALQGLEAARQQAPAAMPAAGAIWHYLHYIQLAGAELERHVERLEVYATTDYLVIDEVTKRNLELVRTMQEGGRHGSVLALLDQTVTAMGARCLKQWLCYPLKTRAAIEARHDAVGQLCDSVERRERCGEAMQAVADLERIAGRILTGQCHARELVSLAVSLRALPPLTEALQGTQGLLASLTQSMDPCLDLAADIEATVVADPPLALKEGGLIRAGVDTELDELRALQLEGKGFIARLEREERERTGIGTLKVQYNRVFGYFLEVTHAHAAKVPEHYIRKQTLANAERYITPELKTYEEKVTAARDRIVAIEYAQFAALRERIAQAIGRVKSSARLVAQCDVLVSLARVAMDGNYCRPTMIDAPKTDIIDGRHPVVERLLRDERFVPNDCRLDARGTAGAKHLLIITGPNMAGKSTVMRQVGLITLLAHMGSFVPATSATIGLTDRIFTRVGASDNLAKGQSTFMVEMAEAATILSEATAQSVILIDELGRGTSTYDGISIAWAVAEYLHDHVKARTLFATHYHELAALAEEKSGVANVTMAVKEWNDQVIFLRQLIPGAANRSYGIQVAMLAGLPISVTTRAKEVLRDLEGTMRRDHHGAPRDQMPLFQSPDAALEQLRDELTKIDPNTLTPIEALQILADFTARMPRVN